jgi:hypothetical protein
LYQIIVQGITNIEVKNIPDDSKGYTNEDMMEVLNGQKEVGDKYKKHAFNFFAKMFCSVAEEVITQFGEEGENAIIKAVKMFGERRGKEMAELVKSLGKELTLINYFIYSTFDARQTTKYKPKIVDGNVEVVIRECAFCDGCKEWDKLDYGKIYCDYIDEAILRGYNPKLKFEIPSSLTRGDKRCIQRYIVINIV